MRAWRETLSICVAALADAGLLRREWTVDQATDWIWARTQPANYEYLARQCHWPIDTLTDRMIKSIVTDLVVATTPGARP
jgi:hypothetical protein